MDSFTPHVDVHKGGKFDGMPLLHSNGYAVISINGDRGSMTGPAALSATTTEVDGDVAYHIALGLVADHKDNLGAQVTITVPKEVHDAVLKTLRDGRAKGFGPLLT